MKNMTNSINLFLEVSKDLDENDFINDEAPLISHQCRHRVIEMSETETPPTIDDSILFDVVDRLDKEGPAMEYFDKRDILRYCLQYADKMMKDANEKEEVDLILFKRAFASLDIWLNIRDDVDDVDDESTVDTMAMGLVEGVEAKRDYCANKIWSSSSSSFENQVRVDDNADKILEGVDEGGSFDDLGGQESAQQDLKKEANRTEDPLSISTSQNQQHQGHLHVPHKKECHKNDEEAKEDISCCKVPPLSTTATPPSIMSSKLKEGLLPTLEEESSSFSSSSSAHRNSALVKEKEQQNHHNHSNSSQNNEDNENQFVSPKGAVEPNETNNHQPVVIPPTAEKADHLFTNTKAHNQQNKKQNKTVLDKKPDESYVAKMNDATSNGRCVHDDSKGKKASRTRKQKQKKQQPRRAKTTKRNHNQKSNTNHDIGNNLEGKDFVVSRGISDDISCITTQSDIKYPQKNHRDYQNHIHIPQIGAINKDDQIQELRNIGYPRGLINVLAVTYLRTFAVRYWLLDNIGGSDEEGMMMTNMRDTVNDHVKMSALFKAPTIFRPLLVNINPEQQPNKNQQPNIQREFPIAFQNVNDNHTRSFLRFEKRMIRLNLLNNNKNNNNNTNSNGTPPSSSVLLTRHLIHNIYKRVEEIAPSLRRDDKKALLVVAVDGDGLLSSSHHINKEFLDAIRLLRSLPLHIVITLYGNNEENDHVTNRNNNNNNNNNNNDALRFLKDELIMHLNDDDDHTNNIQILFDFEREAREVHKHNRWLNYALPLHRIREIGGGVVGKKNVLNLLSERTLTKREISEFCTLVFGKKLGQVWRRGNDPNWRSFVDEIQNLLMREKVQWNPVLEREMPWIDLEELA